MIKENNKEYVEDSVQNPQLATADSAAFARLKDSNSGNKVVYIVRVKDPENTSKLRVFAALKKIETNNTFNTLEVVGYEILNNNKTKKTQKLDRSEVLEKAEEETIIQLFFPWHTVVDIQNLTYQHNKQKR